MCGNFGVWKLQCVWELRRVGDAVCGSCGVWEMQCVGDAVCGSCGV